MSGNRVEMDGRSVARVQLSGAVSPQDLFASESIGDWLELPFCQVGKLFLRTCALQALRHNALRNALSFLS